MNTKLNHVQDWLKLANDANWSVSMMAKFCRVSKRTLERYFERQKSSSPHKWLKEQRQKKALELIQDGLSVKETAMCLGYKHATNFTRTFKNHWGICPTTKEIAHLNQPKKRGIK